MFELKSINKSKTNLIWLDKFSVKWETRQPYEHSPSLPDRDRRSMLCVFCCFYFSSLLAAADYHHHHHRRYRSDLRNSWNLFDYFSSLQPTTSTSRWTGKRKKGVFLAIWGGEREAVNEKKKKIRHFMHQRPLKAEIDAMFRLTKTDIPSPNDVVFTLKTCWISLSLPAPTIRFICPSMVLASLEQQVQLSRSHYQRRAHTVPRKTRANQSSSSPHLHSPSIYFHFASLSSPYNIHCVDIVLKQLKP